MRKFKVQGDVTFKDLEFFLEVSSYGNLVLGVTDGQIKERIIFIDADDGELVRLPGLNPALGLCTDENGKITVNN